MRWSNALNFLFHATIGVGELVRERCSVDPELDKVLTLRPKPLSLPMPKCAVSAP